MRKDWGNWLRESYKTFSNLWGVEWNNFGCRQGLAFGFVSHSFEISAPQLPRETREHLEAVSCFNWHFCPVVIVKFISIEKVFNTAGEIRSNTLCLLIYRLHGKLSVWFTYNTNWFPYEPQSAAAAHVLGPAAGAPEPHQILDTKKYHQTYFLWT